MRSRTQLNPSARRCELIALPTRSSSARIRCQMYWLPKQFPQSQNRAAREEMALASLLAGMAFSAAGTAAVHALQYPVGEATHTPHGLGNAVLLPTVMKNIMPSRISEMAYIARSLDSDLASATDEDAAPRAAWLV